MSATVVKSEVNGSVWKVLVGVGDAVEEDQPLAILESMKMEIPVLAPCDGTVTAIHVEEGQSVSDGADVASIG